MSISQKLEFEFYFELLEFLKNSEQKKSKTQIKALHTAAATRCPRVVMNALLAHPIDTVTSSDKCRVVRYAYKALINRKLQGLEVIKGLCDILLPGWQYIQLQTLHSPKFHLETKVSYMAPTNTCLDDLDQCLKSPKDFEFVGSLETGLWFRKKIR